MITRLLVLLLTGILTGLGSAFVCGAEGGGFPPAVPS